MRRGAEEVVIRRVLEDARRPAVEEDGQLLQLFRERRDGEAVAAGDVADHQVDVLPLHEVAVLAHLLRRAARLVDEHELDRRSAEALFRVRRGKLACIQRLDQHFRRIPRGDAEGSRRSAGQERHHADPDRTGGGRGRRLSGRLRACRGQSENGNGDGEKRRLHWRTSSAGTLAF